jgi:DNA-binding CsgD family transcriptional regulator
MKTLFKVLGQRAREISYLLISFPVSILLFSFVIFGFSTGIALPFAVLIFLLLLSMMERIASFEIKRANKILKTDITVTDNWFSHPFFSWDGVRERVTSLRSWMAIGYVFVSFGWSISSFVLVTLGLAGIFLIISVFGVTLLSSFTHSFQVNDGDDKFSGVISFVESTRSIRLDFGGALSVTDSGGNFILWDLGSYWNLGVGIVLVLVAIWVIPRNTRAMAQMVEGLLSGSFLPQVQNQISKFVGKEKISERDVREAMDKESLQPQLSELSKREREILSLMAQGKSNAGIAKALYITEGSVEKHISNILLKLGLPVEVESHRRVLAVLKYLGIEKPS